MKVVYQWSVYLRVRASTSAHSKLWSWASLRSFTSMVRVSHSTAALISFIIFFFFSLTMSKVIAFCVRFCLRCVLCARRSSELLLPLLPVVLLWSAVGTNSLSP